MNPLALGAGVLLLASLVEGFTEYAFGSIAKAQPFLKYIALVLGVMVAIAYKVDILAAGFGLTSFSPIVGWVVSGLILGRGSNYVNDLVTSFGKSKTLSLVPTPATVAAFVPFAMPSSASTTTVGPAPTSAPAAG